MIHLDMNFVPKFSSNIEKLELEQLNSQRSRNAPDKRGIEEDSTDCSTKAKKSERIRKIRSQVHKRSSSEFAERKTKKVVLVKEIKREVSYSPQYLENTDCQVRREKWMQMKGVGRVKYTKLIPSLAKKIPISKNILPISKANSFILKDQTKSTCAKGRTSSQIRQPPLPPQILPLVYNRDRAKDKSESRNSCYSTNQSRIINIASKNLMFLKQQIQKQPILRGAHHKNQISMQMWKANHDFSKESRRVAEGQAFISEKVDELEKAQKEREKKNEIEEVTFRDEVFFTRAQMIDERTQRSKANCLNSNKKFQNIFHGGEILLNRKLRKYFTSVAPTPAKYSPTNHFYSNINIKFLQSHVNLN
jgi:hypothetical protein